MQHIRQGPAPFVCAYTNGQPDVPALLLALDSVSDIAGLLASAATASLAKTPTGSVTNSPTVAFTCDGTVLPKTMRVSELPPSCVLVLGCGEPFDSDLPQRAMSMHASSLRRSRELGDLVTPKNSSFSPRVRRSCSPTVGPVAADSPRKRTPWMFSPSGRWDSPLAQRPGFK